MARYTSGRRILQIRPSGAFAATSRATSNPWRGSSHNTPSTTQSFNDNVIVALQVVITVVAASFYNIFAELFGGIELTIQEDETTL